MSVTKKEQAARTRARIIKEAIVLFARKGFAPTSTQDLARAVGMTTGILYWHFEDKEALLIAVIEELERRLAEDLIQGSEALRPQKGPVETMRALIRRTAAVFEAHHETLVLVGVVGAEATGTNPRVEKALRKAYANFASLTQGLLQSAQAEGTLAASVDTECAAQMFIGMFMGGLMHQRLYRQSYPTARALPVLEAMLLQSLVGTVPAGLNSAAVPTPRRRRG
jgi:AcrR family transcriptional regulator